MAFMEIKREVQHGEGAEHLLGAVGLYCFKMVKEERGASVRIVYMGIKEHDLGRLLNIAVEMGWVNIACMCRAAHHPSLQSVARMFAFSFFCPILHQIYYGKG